MMGMRQGISQVSLMWMGSPGGTNADQEKRKPFIQVWNGRAQWYNHCGKMYVYLLTMASAIKLIYELQINRGIHK